MYIPCLEHWNVIIGINITKISVDSPFCCEIENHPNQKENICCSKRIEFCEKGWRFKANQWQQNNQKQWDYLWWEVNMFNFYGGIKIIPWEEKPCNCQIYWIYWCFQIFSSWANDFRH